MRTFPALVLALFLPVLPALAQKTTPGLPPVASGLPEPSAQAQKTPSGLVSEVLGAGKGAQRPGPQDYVTVQYTIWTADGRLFESTAAKDGPILLPLDRVMKGLAEGVQLMVEGERRRLWIPAELGFPAGKGLPSGRLVLEVELLATDPPPTQAPADVAQAPADALVTRSGLAYRVLRKGTGTGHPGRSDRVSVHYSGWTTDGKLFDSSVLKRTPASFQVNEVIKGWTEGLRLMVKGDKLRFWIPEKLAYRGEQGKPAGMLVFDVELLTFWP